MGARYNGRVYECVLVDLNTQRDLCAADGACPVTNHLELILALRRVIAWTKRNYAPIISSIESHRRWELSDFTSPGVCCVDGTEGQRKIDFTILPQCARIEADNTLAVPLDLFGRYQQVIFRKRSDDLLENPKADRFLTQLPVREFIVFGNGLEGAVKSLVLSLLAREKRATVLCDACGYWNKATAELALRQIAAKGAGIMTVDELLARKLDRLHRYPIAMMRVDSRGGKQRRPGRVRGNGTGRGRRDLGDVPRR